MQDDSNSFYVKIPISFIIIVRRGCLKSGWL